MTNISEKSNNCTRDATNWNNSILIVSCMSRDEKQLMRKNCKRISRFKCKYLSNCCCSFCVRYFSAFSLFYAHTFWSDCTFSTCASLVFLGKKFLNVTRTFAACSVENPPSNDDVLDSEHSSCWIIFICEIHSRNSLFLNKYFQLKFERFLNMQYISYYI